MTPDKEHRFDPNAYFATGDHRRTVARYLADQVIFSQTDLADAVFYIRAGNVKVVITSEQGEQAIVAIHGKGEFFGLGCLRAQPRRLATAHAVTDSDVMRVDKAEMVRVLHAEPAAAEFFIAHLLERNACAQADLADQLLN
jgi:CRP/FNR family transcriptional regulator, cyclic AMP receptor protein